MFSSKTNCPVPFDQQPLNEYFSLKKSWLFSWSISSRRSFILGLAYILIALFIFFGFLLTLFYSFSNIIVTLSLDLFLSHFVLFFMLIRLYLGWSYIIKRLLSATVFYEESGWYDGQVWIKTSEYLMQDRLIALYQLMPNVSRIKYTFFIVILNLFCTGLVYFIL